MLCLTLGMRGRYLLLALACLSPLTPAHAAPTPGEQDLICDRHSRLLKEQRQRLEELKVLLPGKAAAPTGAMTCAGDPSVVSTWPPA
ncbi:hypothetical protein ACIPIN_09300 [Pseudomonas sp. NPDC087697]|uniref:hypothetical protein n=1 Tax=Pseudomonas sp. NPDC087697 TaxID=3364447 RepID=UPI00382FF4B7